MQNFKQKNWCEKFKRRCIKIINKNGLRANVIKADSAEV